MTNIAWFEDLGMDDVPVVGGKNASLGEMISHLSQLGVRVPGGFATTADAYRSFLRHDGLEHRIRDAVDGLDTDDVVELARVGAAVRSWIEAQPFPEDLEQDVRRAYDTLVSRDADPEAVTWAVRSSATAEDLPEASFAGQQETFLNVGGIENILQAIRAVFASLYNDRAIAYRVHHGFDDVDVALSAGIQRMVRSDVGAAGVMFTLDTESGFDGAVFITSSYGLGEAVVQGAVNPDEFYVSKSALHAGRPAILKRSVGEKAIAMRYTDAKQAGASTDFFDVDEHDRIRLSLTDADVEELGRIAMTIEEHYRRPMDIEWGRDGVDGLLYVLQARPETVASRVEGGTTRRYVLHERSEVIVRGRAIGQRIGAGPVRVLDDVSQMAQFAQGEVLVADMTDPDWEPIMKRAAAIVTNRGGRTCHAAIIARELGIPAIVGTGDATQILGDGRDVTVSCAEGDTGEVFDGLLRFDEEVTELATMPTAPVKIMMNVGTPDQAFSFSRLPNAGVGLARLEFIINRQVGIHPRALLEPDALPEDIAAEVARRTVTAATPRDFFIRRVAEGVSTIAAAFAPEPVIVRLSDFKSNEYANLYAGDLFEPDEENPMIGYRGASRYLSADFRACFDMECEALRFVRDEMGFDNVKLMVPFVRTVAEAEGVIELLGENGLVRGENGLEVVMMCELPSNAVLADEFLAHFDGFSIGSNDMTQLTLGLDRDSSLVADTFDERDPAVLRMLSLAIEACRRHGKYVGICGQGPSDHPDFAAWLVDQGIESVSLNPDTVVDTWLALSRGTSPAP
ncbi:phosphoenolpyruvate synthase [Microbacterium aquimaris]|uniref:phosphoenolpyruvate synthase n=1 Tax=Microbacterium aquimaris TaxID=459816 RepID=UPI002AD2D9F1|nr:phosphoenolpyruvate synthase [Microbacterium aquimaris]MDZ8276598.1 phosphoenolpyruvate synthase [Microbacterium aquimaris]